VVAKHSLSCMWGGKQCEFWPRH